VLHIALSATAALADTLRPVAPETSLWRFTQGRHPAGFRRHPDTALRCGDCAWAIVRRHGKLECRQTRPGCTPVDYSLGASSGPRRALRIDPTQSACEYHEAPLTQDDCFRCGACCREGFDVVEVAPNERFARRHVELIEVRNTERSVVPRPYGRCVALVGTGSAADPFMCKHYAERPRACRSFEVGGDACLVARQRCAVHGVFRMEAMP
jgi:hypothetical protein